MKLLLGLSITSGLLAIYLLAVSAKAAANDPVTSRKERKLIAGQSRTPVLVELFTSEGCSSCPPADAVLARLIREQPFSNAEIIPLSLHVDYWNNIGWKDPFSSARFSERQNDYGRAFRLESVYTPQMIIDGRSEFVGSDEARAARAIESAAVGSKATVKIDIAGNALKVYVSNAPANSRADVMLALTEDGLSSSVRAGENAGRRLTHVAVVRRLYRIGGLAANGAFAGATDLELDKGWRRAELSAVVFVQDRATHRILGVAQSAL